MINEMTITSILSYIEENIEITSINIDTLVQYS
ncbi:AraC family transcriptional regulator, partial [Escherichia coli]|nr:AraC family transcriptional regulator [Escherichia coli]